MIDLLFEPTHRLAALVREREVSALELVDAALAAIDELNPALTHSCTWMPSTRALRRLEYARMIRVRLRASQLRSRANTAVEGWPLGFRSDRQHRLSLVCPDHRYHSCGAYQPHDEDRA